MADTTNIEWCDSTFNPWTGCTKISPACDLCYAEGWAKRSGMVQWGPHAERRRTTPANWAKPLKWEAQAAAFHAEHGRRQRVFCASLADVFDNQVPAEWRRDLFNLILSTPSLDWLLLTKRIGNAAFMIEETLPEPMKALPVGHPLAWPWPNVWLGATICNQEEADRDIPKLLAVPASVRFLSIEPMLGAIDLVPYLYDIHLPVGQALHWVICGGESGPGARPMHPDWANSLRDQCAAAGVPFLFKQWGEWLPICEDVGGITDKLYRSNRKAAPHEDQGAIDELYGRTCTVPYEVIHRDGSRHPPLEPNAFITGAMTTFKAGKKAAGRLLDGITHDGFPA